MNLGLTGVAHRKELYEYGVISDYTSGQLPLHYPSFVDGA